MDTLLHLPPSVLRLAGLLARVTPREVLRAAVTMLLIVTATVLPIEASVTVAQDDPIMSPLFALLLGGASSLVGAAGLLLRHRAGGRMRAGEAERLP